MNNIINRLLTFFSKNNFRDYYQKTALLSLFAMVIVTCLAFNADFRVLKSIMQGVYGNTYVAIIQAAIIAIVIQILLLVSFSNFLKSIIKFKTGAFKGIHLPMTLFNGALGLFALVATLWLSFNTGSIAKLKVRENVSAGKYSVIKDTTDYIKLRDIEIAKLLEINRKLKSESASKEYQDISLYNHKLKAGRIDSMRYEQAVSYIYSKIKKNKLHTKIVSQENKEVKSIMAKYDNLITEQKLSNRKLKVDANFAKNEDTSNAQTFALLIRGTNILYNLINVILNLIILFYFCKIDKSKFVENDVEDSYNHNNKPNNKQILHNNKLKENIKYNNEVVDNYKERTDVEKAKNRYVKNSPKVVDGKLVVDGKTYTRSDITSNIATYRKRLKMYMEDNKIASIPTAKNQLMKYQNYLTILEKENEI